MLKLYSQDPPSSVCQFKDITPDSGVAMENTCDSNHKQENRNVVHLKDIRRSQLQPKKTSHGKARQSLLSSSSSLNNLLGAPRTDAAAVRNAGLNYSRVSTQEEGRHGPQRSNASNTLFTSSSEDSDESDGDGKLQN